MSNTSAKQRFTENFTDTVPQLKGVTTSEYGANVIHVGTLTTADAFQLSDTTRNYVVYLSAAAGGTGVTIKVGKTTDPTTVVLLTDKTVAEGSVITVHLPAGWWIKPTFTSAAFTAYAVSE